MTTVIVLDVRRSDWHIHSCVNELYLKKLDNFLHNKWNMNASDDETHLSV